MPKKPLSKDLIKKIVGLRKTGHTLSEIIAVTGKGKASVFKYIKNVSVLPKYAGILKEKQTGGKYRSNQEWKIAKDKARSLSSNINNREKLILLSALYWGEGNKKDLILTNTDPALIKVFCECLKIIGVEKDKLKVTLRIFEDINKDAAIKYWADIIGISKKQITNVNVLEGKKLGKLKYGMCRVRVKKGGTYFKLIMSMIELVKSEFNAAVVQWIERGTPKP